MKKRNLEIILIVLTVISIIISILEFTNQIYSCSFNTEKLNSILVSPPFTILLWVDNILLYITSIFYMINAIKSKENVRIKVSFSIFSIVTTIVMSTLLINLVASIFGIF